MADEKKTEEEKRKEALKAFKEQDTMEVKVARRGETYLEKPWDRRSKTVGFNEVGSFPKSYAEKMIDDGSAVMPDVDLIPTDEE